MRPLYQILSNATCIRLQLQIANTLCRHFALQEGVRAKIVRFCNCRFQIHSAGISPGGTRRFALNSEQISRTVRVYFGGGSGCAGRRSARGISRAPGVVLEVVRVRGTRYAGGTGRADSLDCSRPPATLTPLFSILGALVTFGHGLFSSSCSLLGSRDRVRATALWHFTHVRVL